MIKHYTQKQCILITQNEHIMTINENSINIDYQYSKKKSLQTKIPRKPIYKFFTYIVSNFKICFSPEPKTKQTKVS